ncbi:hypothetical protein ACHAXR_006474 [Thalassiosira sp. AJA248-18]
MSFSSSSKEFSPLNWQCPQCFQRHSQKNNPLTFLRGTCHHDICSGCITKIVSRRNLVKRSGASATRKSANGSLVYVPCPLDTCSCGKFQVDRAKFSNSSEQGKASDVIDLCNEEIENNNSSKAAGIVKQDANRKACAVKTEVKEEHYSSPSPDSVDSMKQEQHIISSSSPAAHNNMTQNIVSPLPVKKLCNLKPLFEVGDEVYAAWWDPETGVNRQGNATWYPGRITSYNEIGHGQYGPTRLYHVKYNDGDELDNLQDFWVFPKKDYESTRRLEEMGWEAIGVSQRIDDKSNDRWAKDVGWYEVNIDGTAQKFSRLSDAMKAHDVCVVRKHGAQTKKSYLNAPDDYPWLFSNTALGGSNGVEGTASPNAISPSASNNKHGGDSVRRGGNGEDQSDEESRFSEAEESKSDEENEVGWREVKRRRLDLSVEANIQNTNFWKVNKTDIEFTRQAFSTKSLFHLNSFVNGKTKKNRAFAIFVREGVATPGFNPLPTTIDIDSVAGWTYLQLRDALVHTNGEEHGASQTALWLKNATVGSFVIMRHEYPKCQFCPRRLKDPNGKYIGPVYVIGVITKKVVPRSAEEKDISENKMSEFSNHYWGIHNVCRRICDDFEKTYAGGATSKSIRQDLWTNATIPIRSDEEFPDKFDYRG